MNDQEIRLRCLELAIEMVGCRIIPVHDVEKYASCFYKFLLDEDSSIDQLHEPTNVDTRY